MQPSHVLYIESLGHGGMTLALQPGSKNSSAELLSNYKGRQEVGYYEHVLPAGTFERILALLDQVGFGTLPASPPIQPDTPTISVGKMYAGTPPRFDMKGYDAANVPKALDPVRTEMRALIEALSAHPERAIRGEATPVQPSFRGDEPVAFEVHLKNVGTKLLKLDNPFHKRMEQQLTLQLLVAKDKPAGQIQEKDQFWLDCTVEHVHTLDRKNKPPAEREINLGPGEELRFVVRKKLMLQPGRYRAVIFFRNSRQTQAAVSAPGRLGIDPGVFEVTEASP